MLNNKEQLIIDLNRQGKSSKEIAETIQMSGAYVCKILKKHNIQANIPPKFGTYNIKCSICNKEFMPKSRSALTCSLECKKELLSKKTTAYAIKTGAVNVIDSEKEAIILNMRALSCPIGEIAIKTGLSPKSIRQWISRNTDMSTLHGNEKYLKRMNQEDKNLIVSLTRQGIHINEIASKVSYSTTSIKDFLEKINEPINVAANAKDYNKRMDKNIIMEIMSLHSAGKNVTDIAKHIGFTATAVRSFFRKRNIKSNINHTDFSRPCVICNIIFKPKYSDGINKDIYKTCSKECASILMSKNKTKYTKEDIEKVIFMAKGGYSNETIVMKTSVKLSKVKEIIAQYGLYRTEFPGGSAAENEVKMYVESLGFKTEKFKFSTLDGGKEIDILITLNNGIKIGIEYCGLFWHSEGSKDRDKARTMHINKLRKANNLGVTLLTIFEDEWIERQDQVKAFIKSKLRKNNRRFYARQLDIKEIDKGQAQDFLESYHIQGSAKMEISYGLFHEKELLAVVSGGRHHRSTQENVLVLNRLCFKDDISVIGGSSKLLSKLTQYAKDNNYSKLISWSDNRWSEGNVYEKLGFVMKSSLLVDYSYVYGSKRISKQSCKKSDLFKKGAIGNTEREMALSLGLYRIWDCGKKRWELEVK